MTSPQEQLLEHLRRAREDSVHDDNRTNDIISSVKAQEAKYDILSKQLAQERQELAAQLEQVQIGSETASLNSISESDAASSSGLVVEQNHSFQYRAHVKIDDYSDTESRASTAQPPLNSHHLNQGFPGIGGGVGISSQVPTHSFGARFRGAVDPGEVDQTDSGRYSPPGNSDISSPPGRQSIGQITPRSQRKGPQYNFGPAPSSSASIVHSAAQPQESPRFNEPSMRTSRTPDTYSMPLDRAPMRPELPAVYANGHLDDTDHDFRPPSSSHYNHFSHPPRDKDTPPMRPSQYPEGSPSGGLYESAPDSPYSRGDPNGYLPHEHPPYGDMNGRLDYDLQHPDMMALPPHMSNNSRSRPSREGNLDLAANHRSPQHSVSSSDPRSPGLVRTPGYEPDNHSVASSTTAAAGPRGGHLNPNGNALHHNNNPNPHSHSDLHIYSNSSTGALVPRQPLGSQSSNGRVPLNASKAPHLNSANTNPRMQDPAMTLQPPNSIAIDASYGHKFPPSSGQPSPSIASRTQFPVTPSMLNPPGTPSGALDPEEEIIQRNQRWRNPTLKEVLEYLEHRDPRVVFNAAAYLQHLTFDDQAIKKSVRDLHGIPMVSRMIETAAPDLKKNLLGILRNISYGKGTIENKFAMMQAGCVQHLSKVLKTATDPEIQELSCAILWNLSSEPDIKPAILNEAMPLIVSNVIVPESGWLEFESQHESHLITPMPKPLQSPPGAKIPEWSLLFRNATGCLRNLSAGGEDVRRKLREVHHLIDALVHVLNVAIVKNDVNGRAVENCICIIRNLTFHLDQELKHADDPRLTSAMDKEEMGHPNDRSRGTRSRSKGRSKSPSLFANPMRKKNKEVEQFKMPDIPETDPHARGVEVFWQPLMVNICITLMRESSDPDTLEAAAGTLQNMCAGNYFWSPKLRFVVRRRMGLPVLRELLVTFENDSVIASVAGALRNVCQDKENKRLIGLHATAELVKHLPGEGEKEYRGVLWDKVGYILLTLTQLCRQDEDNCRYVLQCDGLYRVIPLAKYRSKDKMVVPPRIVKLAEGLLVVMWDVSKMRAEYKEHGFIREHFDPTAIVGIKRKYEAYTLTKRGKTKSVDDLNSGYGTGASRRTGGKSTLNTSRGGAPDDTHNRAHQQSYASTPNSPAAGYPSNGNGVGVGASHTDYMNESSARSQSVDMDHFAQMDLNQQHAYGYESRTDGLDPYSMQGYNSANYDPSTSAANAPTVAARNLNGNNSHHQSQQQQPPYLSYHAGGGGGGGGGYIHSQSPSHSTSLNHQLPAPDSHVYSSSSLKYYRQKNPAVPQTDYHQYSVDKSGVHHGGQGHDARSQSGGHLGVSHTSNNSYSPSPRHLQQQFPHTAATPHQYDVNSSSPQSSALDTNGHTWL